MKLLIANRGEIARRIIITARGLGWDTVAVYADPDRNAPFVDDADEAIRIGPAALDESYLSIEAILEAAWATEADAVHPGYGFLSENATFARAVLAAGLVWVGPRPEAIEEMGLKIAARHHAEAAGVPTIPGYSASQADEDLARAADDIGFPVLVKASAGGGGRGIRIAESAAGFGEALTQARAEALGAFGDPAVLVEKYIEVPRHIEVQILGDKHGSCLHLGTRECSVQRRYQKLLEEAPAPRLDPLTSAAMCADAVALGQAIGYDSTGTVEFIVDDRDGSYYFLEMNTRLQVEHPVTEAITGIDLVARQIASALGEPLGFTQDEVRFSGHAFEARINTEDAAAGWMPHTGTVEHLVVPDGVRWDSGVELGSQITPYYDAMIAKLIVHGSSRPEALQRLRGALDRLIVGPVVTTAGFHRWLTTQPELIDATITTRTLDSVTYIPPLSSADMAPVAAQAWDAAAYRASGGSVGTAASPWQRLGSWRLTPHRPSLPTTVVDADGERHDIGPELGEPGVGPSSSADAEPDAELDRASEETRARRVPTTPAADVDIAKRSVAVNGWGTTYCFAVPSRQDLWTSTSTGAMTNATAITAPFPATVAEVHVRAGDSVEADAPLVVIEAMKMLHTLRAPKAVTIDEVRVGAGDQVESGQTLISFAAAAPRDE